MVATGWTPSAATEKDKSVKHTKQYTPFQDICMRSTEISCESAFDCNEVNVMTCTPSLWQSRPSE